MPVELHADAAQQRVLALCLENVADVGIAQVRVADDCVGIARPVGLRLYPRHLVHGALGRPIGLHVD